MDENRLNGLNQQSEPKWTKVDKIRERMEQNGPTGPNVLKWIEQTEWTEVDKYRLNKRKWTKWIKVD